MNNLYNKIYWNWYLYCGVFLCVLVSTFFALCFEFNMTSIYRHNCLLALLTPQFINNKIVQKLMLKYINCIGVTLTPVSKGSMLTTFFGEGDLWCGYHKLLSVTFSQNLIILVIIISIAQHSGVVYPLSLSPSGYISCQDHHWCSPLSSALRWCVTRSVPPCCWWLAHWVRELDLFNYLMMANKMMRWMMTMMSTKHIES